MKKLPLSSQKIQERNKKSRLRAKNKNKNATSECISSHCVWCLSDDMNMMHFCCIIRMSGYVIHFPSTHRTLLT